jgi:uncharacterized membrane protein YkoI
MKLLSFSALVLLLFLSPLTAGAQDSKSAKITRDEAQHIALKQYPGARVTAAKLESVHGVLVWSIEVAPSNVKTFAVAVDAQTGRILPGKRRAP